MSVFNDLMGSKIDLLGQKSLGIDIREIESLPKEEKIKRIAVQFEEMLLNTLLKSAFKFDNKDSSLGSMKTLGDMRIMYLSQYIADSGGLGYQEILSEKIKEYTNLNASDKNNTQDMKLNLSVPEKYNFNAGLTLPAEVDISSEFGWRDDPITGKKRFHNGIDLRIAVNSPVKSILDGQIVFSGWKEGYGKVVEVKHPNNLTSLYAHNSNLDCKEGDRVKSGETIALSGTSGRSTGPHLHFEIRKGDTPIDPVGFFRENKINVF